MTPNLQMHSLMHLEINKKTSKDCTRQQVANPKSVALGPSSIHLVNSGKLEQVQFNLRYVN